MKGNTEEQTVAQEELTIEHRSIVDFVVRRKKILKGKIAPPGHQFITISFNFRKMKYSNGMCIRGAVDGDGLRLVSEYLFEGVREKYNLKA
jgi:hypothetical protein